MRLQLAARPGALLHLPPACRLKEFPQASAVLSLEDRCLHIGQMMMCHSLTILSTWSLACALLMSVRQFSMLDSISTEAYIIG